MSGDGRLTALFRRAVARKGTLFVKVTRVSTLSCSLPIAFARSVIGALTRIVRCEAQFARIRFGLYTDRRSRC